MNLINKINNIFFKVDENESNLNKLIKLYLKTNNSNIIKIIIKNMNNFNYKDIFELFNNTKLSIDFKEKIYDECKNVIFDKFENIKLEDFIIGLNTSFYEPLLNELLNKYLDNVGCYSSTLINFFLNENIEENIKIKIYNIKRKELLATLNNKIYIFDIFNSYINIINNNTTLANLIYDDIKSVINSDYNNWKRLFGIFKDIKLKNDVLKEDLKSILLLSIDNLKDYNPEILNFLHLRISNKDLFSEIYKSKLNKINDCLNKIDFNVLLRILEQNCNDELEQKVIEIIINSEIKIDKIKKVYNENTRIRYEILTLILDKCKNKITKILNESSCKELIDILMYTKYTILSDLVCNVIIDKINSEYDCKIIIDIFKDKYIENSYKKFIYENVKNKLVDIFKSTKLEYKIQFLNILSNDLKYDFYLQIKEDLMNDDLDYILKSTNYELLIDDIINKYGNGDIKIIKQYYKYINHPILFIKNYNKIMEAFEILEIDKTKFIQYFIGSDYNWIDDLCYLIENNLLYNFNNVKNKIFNKFLEKANDYNNIKHNFDLIKIYINYPNLLLELSNLENTTLNIKENLYFLMNSSTKYNINNINDFINLENIFKTQLMELNDDDFVSLKDSVIKIITQHDINSINRLMYNYGGSEAFNLLKFNNKDLHNKNFNKNVDYIIVLFNFMEDLLRIDNIDDLKYLINNLINNFDLIKGLPIKFSLLEENIRKVYEQDIIINLERNKKQSSSIYDYSKNKYCILAHVVSNNENIDDLIKGKSSNLLNFISLTPITHRYIHFFNTKKEKIVFGYRKIKKNNFITSCIEDMSSNELISENSGQIKNNYHEQRGIIESSMTVLNSCCEFLFFRDGLKPDCLIIAGNRELTQEEQDIVNKYKLDIVYTQEEHTMIIDPIENEAGNADLDLIGSIDLNLPRKEDTRVAIIPDTYGLYEPTLALLEDIRKNGIKKIYSLKYTIGPFTKEILDLFKEYNVELIENYKPNILFNKDDDAIRYIIDDGLSQKITPVKYNKDNLKHSLNERRR